MSESDPRPRTPDRPSGTGVGSIRRPTRCGSRSPLRLPARGRRPTRPARRSPAVADEVAELKTQLAERTADLQRLQAEYVNYKRRVDRDRDVARKGGVEAVLKDLMSVLDDIRSAREHDELTGGFKAVADEVERVTGRYGLETYGTKGDPFDPHIHEALLHAHADGIDGPTCVEILQPGYRVGERILRPARVAVAEPDPDAPPADPDPVQSQEAPDAPTADDEQ